MTIKFEVTDTFGGESNYSWVRREEHTEWPALSNRAIVRRAKAFAGFTGIPSRVENYGDMIAIYPRGLCQVCFVTFE
jgi:hypothetical protein